MKKSYLSSGNNLASYEVAYPTDVVFDSNLSADAKILYLMLLSGKTISRYSINNAFPNKEMDLSQIYLLLKEIEKEGFVKIIESKETRNGKSIKFKIFKPFGIRKLTENEKSEEC